jgi:hypothetical protein
LIERKRAAQEFPVRLATTLRRLLAARDGSAPAFPHVAAVVPLPKVDPIIPAIAAHRESMLGCAAAASSKYEDGEAETRAWNTAAEHQEDCLAKLLTTMPETSHGCARLLKYLDSRQWDDPGQPSIFVGAFVHRRRDVVAAAEGWFQRISRMIERLDRTDIGATEASENDPIFEAIERHRLAWAELGDRCSALDEAGTPEARAEEHRLNKAVNEARDEMIEIEPTTLAGAVALLRYVAVLGGSLENIAA